MSCMIAGQVCGVCEPGGYFGNLLGTIKHGKSYPLFDNISSEIVGTVINSKIIDFSKTDKESPTYPMPTTQICLLKFPYRINPKYFHSIR